MATITAPLVKRPSIPKPAPNPWGVYTRYEEGWSAQPNLDAGIEHDYNNVVILTTVSYDSQDPAQAAILQEKYKFDPEGPYRYFVVEIFKGAPNPAVFGDYPPSNIIGA